MKKFFLSLFVVLTFTGYALKLRGGSDEGKVSVNTNVDTTTLPATTSDVTVPTPTPSVTSNGEDDEASVPAASATNTAITTTTPSAQKATTQTGQYKNGTYTGGSADAYYGNVQVRVTVQSGKIANVEFLDYPQSHQTSVSINSQAMPYLRSEAIQAQSANVNTISGATLTSSAFRQSLQDALNQAKA